MLLLFEKGIRDGMCNAVCKYVKADNKYIQQKITTNHATWLKPYIDMNTELRTQAKNDFEKDYFKLKNNAAYGKTMEILENREISD